MTVQMTATPPIDDAMTINTVTAVWLMDDEPVVVASELEVAEAAAWETELVTTTWLTELVLPELSAAEVAAGALV